MGGCTATSVVVIPPDDLGDCSMAHVRVSFLVGWAVQYLCTQKLK